MTTRMPGSALIVAIVASVPLLAGSALARKEVKCDVAIIGGGPGGLYSAYRLGAQLGSGVCLFEKNNRLGGRIYDVKGPGGAVFGTGAMRIMETQSIVFSLADELGMEYEAAPWRDDLISARGYFSFDSTAMNQMAYPLVPDNTNETELYDILRFGPERANVMKYPDFRSYTRAVVGEQQYHYLTEVYRFRADFEAPLSASSYLDYLDEEWDVCCTPYYPIGGMSQFIDRMAERARKLGVQIFTGEPVQDLSGSAGKGSGTYTLLTPGYQAKASRVIVAADPHGFNHVSGDLARAIQSQQIYKDILPIKVVTVAQWWPRAWWKEFDPQKDIHRAWSTEHCFNSIEIPIQKYAADQLVTRSVYDDDSRCADFWDITYQQGGVAAVEKEVHRGLSHMFAGVNIPKPLQTTVQVWPNAWYWLRAGSTYTNSQLATWAIDPLPGERVSMVGEAYNVQRSGWSDGAYKSSINTLNARYGMNLSGATAGPGVPPPPPAKKHYRKHRHHK